MPRDLIAPSLTDSPEDQADWLELYAIRDTDRNASFADLVAALTVSGTTDAIDEDDEDEVHLTDNDRCEARAEAAFTEIADRLDSCGGDDGGYPFEVTSGAIASDAATLETVYAFLLLLGKYGHDAADANGGAKLFEEVCARAVESYLGGRNEDVESVVFGFPRERGPRGFARALDRLCRQMGEGLGHRKRPKSSDQKDAKLDLVAWRGFADRRQGKLIAFGQCATGRNWREKAQELLSPVDWCTCWMRDRPAVWPVRMFFVPHRAPEAWWLHTCMLGGILFDRCRIAQHAVLIDGELQSRMAQWSADVAAVHLHSGANKKN